MIQLYTEYDIKDQISIIKNSYVNVKRVEQQGDYIRFIVDSAHSNFINILKTGWLENLPIIFRNNEIPVPIFYFMETSMMYLNYCQLNETRKLQYANNMLTASKFGI